MMIRLQTYLVCPGSDHGDTESVEGIPVLTFYTQIRVLFLISIDSQNIVWPHISKCPPEQKIGGPKVVVKLTANIDD